MRTYQDVEDGKEETVLELTIVSLLASESYSCKFVLYHQDIEGLLKLSRTKQASNHLDPTINVIIIHLTYTIP